MFIGLLGFRGIALLIALNLAAHRQSELLLLFLGPELLWMLFSLSEKENNDSADDAIDNLAYLGFFSQQNHRICID